VEEGVVVPEELFLELTVLGLHIHTLLLLEALVDMAVQVDLLVEVLDMAVVLVAEVTLLLYIVEAI
jgi:hypothetical protein